MKKGLFLVLTFIFMILFVGCSISNQLKGTKWRYTTSEEISTGKFKTLTCTYEFKEDDTFVYTEKIEYPAGSEEENSDSVVNGTWYCEDNKLYLEQNNASVVFGYDIIIKKDELIIMNHSSSFIKLKKII